ncbi:tartrate dehydrogenase/decarboxylase / D-malate dehydrogenase [Halobacillus karajensis]|uniref:D-malate dehydrogenase (decarboxylating) n=1 Tax=Halobacillus karajensis TaxID=195088 RepID=A0A024P3V9_9BACI|nr:tartrate dehydrogenase [Halobacillus karajensis]CDQ19121.1 putative tartrate dehydrogenase/decarboxylase TtuC [Halobacillus karajensis]CDQ22805.1 putative tartrate dehydrogenase/decarboxylase TtuC [Halobacillus karajensis]CDQ26287.1 putative tartrate dehydrogenase/decarboxylase TtuC [Halobacillus karajensis]SEH41285.1 tartrate dehydrogenase/decarboxylase / D-malate dehydrogenase [Halobacillus karajensis]
MKTYHLAVLPGDGIGPEVVNEGMKVVQALSEADSSFQFESTTLEWNSEYYLKHNRMMPENGLSILENYDAIYFGAVGDPRVPEHIPIWELIMPIRKNFHQYVNLRPIKQLPGVKSPIHAKGLIDFYVYRENAEGEYSNSGGRLYQGTSDELAIQNTVITKKGVERLARYAFEYAEKTGVKKVVNATKSNAIIHSMNLWDESVKSVAASFPEIEVEDTYIDALAAHLVQRPETFDVIVASNLFGDILSDLGAALVGGLGLSPSANLNPERNYPSMFEPIHGSAPDISGKQTANPIAQIWSAALMLEHLGREDLASIVMKAIENVVNEKTALTPDLGGTARTFETGDAIVQHIHKQT